MRSHFLLLNTAASAPFPQPREKKNQAMSSSKRFRAERSYEGFYSEWVAEQEAQLHDLRSALKEDVAEGALSQQVVRVVKHYEAYYRVKAEAARGNVLAMFSPTWTSTLENAFLWIGGWRPSTIFQLAYAEAGRQLESELADLLSGAHSSNLAALSSKQLYRINELQCETLEEEEELSQRMALLQQTLADQPWLAIARQCAAEGAGAGSNLESALDTKIKELQNLLAAADSLRLGTLKRVLEVLTPRQAVQLLITAAQLHLCIHRKGREKDK